MSNSIVGAVYRDIIEDVINSSRMDFEDAGIDEATLRELQILWQERLSLTGVAKFPWDPEPEPTSPPGNTQGIKFEMSSPPMYGNGSVNISTAPQAFSNPAMAAMRAAQQIQQFAHEEKVPAALADESIKGVMKRAGFNENANDSDASSGGGGLMLPGGGRIAQVDGASDAIEMSQYELDQLLHSKILQQCPSTDIRGSSVQSNEQNIVSNDTSASSFKIRSDKSRKLRTIELIIPQTDGTLESSEDEESDDEEDDDIANVGGSNSTRHRNLNNGDDSDAINSDLDDPEDDLNSQDDEDNEDAGMIMLCLYDKVQRVKNKWKCFLKDGVVNVNGKDYLFGKGNGEYEW
ncbi:transcription factor IIA, alpha/beta subunit [Dipodascopsis uninucleata]